MLDGLLNTEPLIDARPVVDPVVVVFARLSDEPVALKLLVSGWGGWVVAVLLFKDVLSDKEL